MRNTLLITCSALWLAAGFNVVRMGVLALSASEMAVWTMLVGMIVVFALFGAMFMKISLKNMNRIESMPAAQQKIWNCMPVKSYLIMVFMIALGVCLRRNPAIPRGFIAFFYIGLGSALALAGALYLIRVFRDGPKGPDAEGGSAQETAATPSR